MVSFITLVKTFLLSVLMLAGMPALATCSSGDNNGVVAITLPEQLPVNATVGTVLYDSYWVNASPSRLFSACSGSLRGTMALATAGTLVSGNAVYATSIPGIGIATYFAAGLASGGGPLTGAYITPASNGGTVATAGSCPDGCGPMGAFRTQLVVTGPVSAGTMTYSGVYATAYWSGSKVGALTINGTASVVAPTCTVQTTSVAVSLPTVSTSAFSAVGKTAGRVAFNLGLDCTGPANVGIVMTDANSPTNATQNLTIQSGGASGMALQVLWNNQLLTFGQQSPFVSGGTPVTNPAMVTLGTSPPSRWTLPFSAQYIRTGAITPGAVVARATFVMTYK